MILLCLLAVLCAAPFASAADNPITEGLFLESLNRGGRAPFPVDALEARIASGDWHGAQAGDEVAIPDATTRRWTNIAANAEGWFTPRGGYLDLPLVSNEPEIRILQAAGHSYGYLNGRPLPGDSYRYDWLMLPIQLLKGTNHLLLQSGRGRIKATLSTPKTAAFFNLRDLTLPDAIQNLPLDEWAGVMVVNSTDGYLNNLEVSAAAPNQRETFTSLPPIPPLSFRKVPVRLRLASAGNGTNTVAFHLQLLARKALLDEGTIQLRAREKGQPYKKTFRSEIDGSIQYYAVNPSAQSNTGEALFLSLHGASVEAIGQAESYSSKRWGVLVAPTNRRPYGFDWEDWGRLDALEVLKLAQREFRTDPAQTYLTGHSMGGHGTWHVGSTFPDRFAAIAPSAGWVSFSSYSRGRGASTNSSELREILNRASHPSETLLLTNNLLHFGVYVLHGDADDNVPVSEARTMRSVLQGLHHDWDYFEQPKAGHWWDASDEPGADCVDWAPIFDYFARHKIPTAAECRTVQFTTMNPAISDHSRWLSIHSQVRALEPSSIKMRFDPGKRRFTGQSENVARLALEGDALGLKGEFDVELDGDKFQVEAGPLIWLERKEHWKQGARPLPLLKGPHRAGPFKEAFNHHFLFVYGTRGSKEENAWALNKARFDAENWWYRGNGAVDLVADDDFNPARERDRGIIVYGNADTHGRWKELLGDSPIQVRRTGISIGSHELRDPKLGALFVRPRPGSQTALIAVVAGTDVPGARLTDKLPYFVSGAEYPDFAVFGPESLLKGAEGVLAAGFFGNEWEIDPKQAVFPSEKK